MQRNYLVPSEICNEVIESGVKKASMKAVQLLLLGVLAGMFIAFAAEGSNMAIHKLALNDYGAGKALAGVIFTTGLMLVIVAGGELFTGNTMMLASIFERKITWWGMLRNWIVVYAGNLIGSLMIAWLMVNSGLFDSSNGGLGAYTIKVAAYKCGLSFSQALILGILCNMLVCLAVWMAYGAKDMTGKLLAIYFPISLFITSGFEHSVANMYYIPAGILAKSNPSWVDLSGVSGHKLEALNWLSFITNNLIPVTIGNILGGSVLIAAIYWFVYIKANNSNK